MTICYVGGGRLGSALAAWSAHYGKQVIIADVNNDVVDAINGNKFVSNEPFVEEYMRQAILDGRVTASTDISTAAAQAAAIYIIVPTPSMDSGDFSIKAVLAAAHEIGVGLRSSTHAAPLVVVVSTINPGDTVKIKAVIRCAAGRDIHVVYSPEFIAQGSIIHDFVNPDVLLIGSDDQVATTLAINQYTDLVQPKHTCVMSTVSAEIAKVGLNAALVTKMAVAAQLTWLCHHAAGADARDVLHSVGSDSRIGAGVFSPGLRPGGPCLPRDNRALEAACLQAGVPCDIAIATDLYSSEQDHLLFNTVLDNAKGNILVIGLAYKSGVPISEESASLALYKSMVDAGLAVRAFDKLLVPGPLDELISWADTIVLADREYHVPHDLSQKVVIDCWGKFTGRCNKLVVLGVHS